MNNKKQKYNNDIDKIFNQNKESLSKIRNNIKFKKFSKNKLKGNMNANEKTINSNEKFINELFDNNNILKKTEQKKNINEVKKKTRNQATT